MGDAGELKVGEDGRRMAREEAIRKAVADREAAEAEKKAAADRKLAANRKHRAAVTAEAVAAMNKFMPSGENSIAIVAAIVRGEIPHVSINFL